MDADKTRTNWKTKPFPSWKKSIPPHQGEGWVAVGLIGYCCWSFRRLSASIGGLIGFGLRLARDKEKHHDVPTISEAGVPGYESENWFGLFVPARTPQRIVARLNDAVVKVVRSPEIQSQFAALGADAVGNSPGEFAAFVRRDMERYARVVKLSGAKLD
jgi:hypothetical protein